MPRYTLKVEDETYERIRAEAEDEDRSIGWMMNRLINEALEARDDRRKEAGR